MNVLVIYAHPSDVSFTYQAKEAFVRGAKTAGHNVTVSDLYKMGFNPVLSEKEYLREAFYEEKKSVPEDVICEQKKINHADCVVFIFPNFWTSAPAILEGWFQRVWTYGFAYGDNSMKVLDKAVFLMTMGGDMTEAVRREQIDAIKCTMIGDRINNRAKVCEFHVFDRMTRGYGNDETRAIKMKQFCEKIYNIGLNI